MFVYQREPHARQLAFQDVPQPANLGERCELARRTCAEVSLEPASMWIDGMDDQSRALFGDLPSPAIVVDPFGVIRVKLPWAEPEVLGPRLETLLRDVGLEAETKLIFAAPTTPAAAPDLSLTGAALYVACLNGTPPEASQRTPTELWAAALAILPLDAALAGNQDWLTLTAYATLAAEHTDDPRRRDWLDRLIASSSLPVQHWARELLVEQLLRDGTGEAAAAERQKLENLRREQPWLVPTPR